MQQWRIDEDLHNPIFAGFLEKTTDTLTGNTQPPRNSLMSQAFTVIQNRNFGQKMQIIVFHI
jgi:hypothetical protein